MKDNFSTQSEWYAKFRPEYPEALFDFINSIVPVKNCAWDCGTGNGQVAKELSKYFKEVKATDISTKQLENAPALANVEYINSPAEDSPFPAQYFDLITVAQAVHWFDFDSFFKEVYRTAKPGAKLIIWGYGLLKIDEACDQLMHTFYHDEVGPYWDKERRHIDSYYSTIPFPFDDRVEKTFEIKVSWTLSQLQGYLESWSAVQHYKRIRGEDPVDDLISQMEKFWPEDKVKNVRFPVFLKSGTVL